MQADATGGTNIAPAIATASITDQVTHYRSLSVWPVPRGASLTYGVSTVVPLSLIVSVSSTVPASNPHGQIGLSGLIFFDAQGNRITSPTYTLVTTAPMSPNLPC